MLARTIGTVILSLVVFIIVSLLVVLGALWLTGGTVRAATIGVVCGLVAAFVVSAAGTAGRRAESASRREINDDTSGLQSHLTEPSGPEQDDPSSSDPEGRQP